MFPLISTFLGTMIFMDRLIHANKKELIKTCKRNRQITFTIPKKAVKLEGQDPLYRRQTYHSNQCSGRNPKLLVVYVSGS